jgi:hypothetical protein
VSATQTRKSRNSPRARSAEPQQEAAVQGPRSARRSALVQAVRCRVAGSETRSRAGESNRFVRIRRGAEAFAAAQLKSVLIIQSIGDSDVDSAVLRWEIRQPGVLASHGAIRVEEQHRQLLNCGKAGLRTRVAGISDRSGSCWVLGLSAPSLPCAAADVERLSVDRLGNGGELGRGYHEGSPQVCLRHGEPGRRFEEEEEEGRRRPGQPRLAAGTSWA